VGVSLLVRLHVVLQHLRPVDDPQETVAIERQSERHPFDLDPPEEAAIAVEDLGSLFPSQPGDIVRHDAIVRLTHERG